MKFKKCLLFLISILVGCSGLLFGCNPKPLKLGIYFGETEIQAITLNLPTEKNKTETTEGETTEETLDNLKESASFTIKGENVNDIFKSGLDVNYNNRLIKLELTNKTDNSYEYKITALTSETSNIIFESKDKKAKTTLKVIVNQDCDKIEKNVQSANYIVFGEDKELSSTMLTFTPSTTTNKEIEYSFPEGIEYDGLSIVDGKIVFDKTKTSVKLNDVIVNQISINAKHKNYESASEQEQKDYLVENIVFDILSPINDLVAINQSGEQAVSVKTIEFASNVPTIDSLNFVE